MKTLSESQVIKLFRMVKSVADIFDETSAEKPAETPRAHGLHDDEFTPDEQVALGALWLLSFARGDSRMAMYSHLLLEIECISVAALWRWKPAVTNESASHAWVYKYVNEWTEGIPSLPRDKP